MAVDQTTFFNKYIAALAEQLKTLTMEKTMLITQLSLANEEMEELRKQISQQVPVPDTPGSTSTTYG
jgi:hypothetical protein